MNQLFNNFISNTFCNSFYNNILSDLLVKHNDVICYIPTIYLFNKITNNPEYYRLYFYFLIVGLSSYELYKNPQLISFEYENIVKYNYYGEKFCFYLLTHFIYELIYDKETYNSLQFIIHHSIFILMAFCMLYNKYMFIGALIFGSHEISSIFLSIKRLKLNNQKINNLLDYSFVVSFIGIRCTTLPIITYKVYNKNNTFFYILFCDNLLHIYWIFLKFKSIYKKSKKYKKNNQKYIV